MGGEGEDLEPLFDYQRVQPSNFVCIEDDDSDVSELPVKKRAKITTKIVNEDEDVKVIEVAGDDDWLPPPPNAVFHKSKESGEDSSSTIKALRSKKMELMSYTNTVVDVMQEAEDSAKKEAEVLLQPSSEAAAQAPQGPNNDRAKIVITIQNRAEHKQFRVYADEKFERVFKMYTDRKKLDPKNLVFTFDGDKIDESTTPSDLEMEEGDMIEIHTKKR